MCVLSKVLVSAMQCVLCQRWQTEDDGTETTEDDVNKKKRRQMFAGLDFTCDSTPFQMVNQMALEYLFNVDFLSSSTSQLLFDSNLQQSIDDITKEGATDNVLCTSKNKVVTRENENWTEFMFSCVKACTLLFLECSSEEQDVILREVVFPSLTSFSTSVQPLLSFSMSSTFKCHRQEEYCMCQECLLLAQSSIRIIGKLAALLTHTDTHTHAHTQGIFALLCFFLSSCNKN